MSLKELRYEKLKLSIATICFIHLRESLQYNGFFKNDVIFSPWNHVAIT